MAAEFGCQFVLSLLVMTLISINGVLASAGYDESGSMRIDYQEPNVVGRSRKESFLCLVSDVNLHINGQFIESRGEDVLGGFTSIRSLVLLYGPHQVYIGLNPAMPWDGSVDHLTVLFDGAPVPLPTTKGATWAGPEHTVIIRMDDTNNMVVEVSGNFMVVARAMERPVEESHVENHGIGHNHSSAYLDLNFKFYSLSPDVDGVLGQFYRADTSQVELRTIMTLVGGLRKFASSNPFAADCAVAQFNGQKNKMHFLEDRLNTMSCTNKFSGDGIVCKK